MANEVVGQVPAEEPDFTFHVYVDPAFGDDQLAYHLNPGTSPDPNRQPLSDYPNGYPTPSTSDSEHGFIQHAPYSFRTLTGGSQLGAIGNFGALQYLMDVFPPDQRPWTNPASNQTVTWIVIHCLPGLYGPDSSIDPSLSDYDTTRPATTTPLPYPGSQFRYNGELFPISMRNNVSIQGTSALDTIFDARGTETAIIRSWTGVFSGSGILDGPMFIDSLTLRGARSDGEDVGEGSSRNDSGAAVSIGRENLNRVTITNCFIVDNDVGIGIENDVASFSANSVGRPIIVNNTIAWNTVGIWSGNTRSGQPSLGVAQPVLLNNIIDPGHPTRGTLTAFSGLHPWDLQAFLPGTTTLQSFNAFPTGVASVATPLSNWPSSGVRPPAVPDAVPRVDLAPYMPTPTKARGILYVNDAIRVSGDLAQRAPHDFRLAPHTAPDPAEVSAQSPITELNPLVNQGISLGSSSAITSITLANHVSYWVDPSTDPEPSHQVLDESPGFHPELPEPDRFHAWDWDCEGFGNPRVRCRAGFANFGSPGIFDNIDLGADEMDELIVSGFVPFTRMFATFQDPAFPFLTRPLFFDLRTGAGPSHPRPAINVQVGVENWWDHTHPAVGVTPPDVVTVSAQWLGGAAYASNFTDAKLSYYGLGGFSYREQLINLFNPPLAMPPPATPFGGQPVIMRNHWCDFSPTLMGDFHPLWGSTVFKNRGSTDVVVQGDGDVYAANPWFGGDSTMSVSSAGFGVPNDNWTSYRSSHPDWPGGVVDGTLNPPWVWWTGVPTAECGSLSSAGFLTSSPTTLFGCGPVPGDFVVGDFGFGDASCPTEMFPLVLSWWGIRYNAQVYEPNERSNLQTWLTVIGDSAQANGPEEAPMAPGPTAMSESWYPGPRLSRERAFGPAPALEERTRLLEHLRRNARR